MKAPTVRIRCPSCNRTTLFLNHRKPFDLPTRCAYCNAQFVVRFTATQDPFLLSPVEETMDGY